VHNSLKTKINLHCLRFRAGLMELSGIFYRHCLQGKWLPTFRKNEQLNIINRLTRSQKTTVRRNYFSRLSSCGPVKHNRWEILCVDSVIQKGGLRVSFVRRLSFGREVCTSCRRYGFNSKRRLNTHQTVGYGIPSSLLALRVKLRGLRSKLSWIHLTFSSDTRGRPELLSLHRHPVCSNWWFQRQMLSLVDGWMLKRRRNARCTAAATQF
jgi:hypothetical protein